MTGANIADIDGSTWDPWAQRLLFTTENAGAPTYAATPGYPSTVTDVSGALGRGGYEGIQNDSDGNIWIVEDVGGPSKPGTTAKVPNSFIYRYVPAHQGDLANGKLQVLQVLNAAGDPITKASQTPLNSPDQVALHTYGASFKTQWVTDPRHRRRRERAVPGEHARDGQERHAVQAARERRRSARHDRLQGVLLRRDRRHERDQPRERDRRLDGRLQAARRRTRRPTPARSACSTRATRPTPASTT